MPELLGYVSKIRIGTGQEVPINDDDAVQKSEFLDLFYPVGSYYETSDSSFDPNTKWGGTWVLEAEGKVHVSAGSNYTINSTGGVATRNYTPAGSVGNTTLTTAQMPSHAHSVNAFYTAASDISHTHYCPNSAGYVWVAAGSSHACAIYNDGSYTSGMSAHSTDHKHQVPAHNTNNSGNTKPHNHGFTGTAATIDVRQPYIVVNRWHRTA